MEHIDNIEDVGLLNDCKKILKECIKSDKSKIKMLKKNIDKYLSLLSTPK